MVVVEAVELGIRVEMAVMGEVDVREVDMRAEMVDMGEMAFRVQTVGVAMVVAECLHASQRIKLQPVIISVISYQGKTGQENCIGRQSVFHAYVCD